MVSRERIQKIHDSASARADNSYIDPQDGMLVMTAHYLGKRGFCCGAGCRHCPYPPADQVAAGRPLGAESWQQKG